MSRYVYGHPASGRWSAIGRDPTVKVQRQSFLFIFSFLFFLEGGLGCGLTGQTRARSFFGGGGVGSLGSLGSFGGG